jgi:hypothetical protein
MEESIEESNNKKKKKIQAPDLTSEIESGRVPFPQNYTLPKRFS